MVGVAVAMMLMSRPMSSMLSMTAETILYMRGPVRWASSAETDIVVSLARSPGCFSSSLKICSALSDSIAAILSPDKNGVRLPERSKDAERGG